jgi:hypothetical protein
MKCDSWASLLACTFASPCLGHEPKARVAIIGYNVVQMGRNVKKAQGNDDKKT